MERQKLPQRPEKVFTTYSSGEYVLAYGSLNTGYKLVGPFKSYDDAKAWYANMHHDFVHFMELNRPEIAISMVKYNPDLEREG